MPPHHPGKLLIRSDRLWDGLADRPATGIDILVENGTITRLGEEVQASPGTNLIDLAECTVLPGLIDCHVHLPTEAADHESAAYQVLTALPAMRDLLHNGFTTVRDLGSAHLPLNVALRRAVDEHLTSGPRILAAPNILSPRGGHGDKAPNLAQRYGAQVGTVADGEHEVRRQVREQARAGADWIKFAGSGGFSSPADAPDATAYSQEEVDTLVATARDLHLPCATHAFPDEAVLRALRAGVRSVEHATLATPETLNIMAQAGTYLVPTQYTQRYFLDHLDDDTFWEHRSPTMRDTYRRYEPRMREGLLRPARSDVRIAFGTDAGMFPHADNWREFPTMVEHGLPPLRALRAATSTAADLLNRPDLGRLTLGAASDLVAVAGNPFEDIEAMGRVRFVVQSGRVVRPVEKG
ncbi:amidohydrolase family protein [Streptomyces sp. NPDC046939]|uniref:metal-dependent hydrolase family protein n=1 Tax=Streptomyces sp. NPDC046939 TaxID=3155376 RepID=UPI0033ED26CB